MPTFQTVQNVPSGIDQTLGTKFTGVALTINSQSITVKEFNSNGDITDCYGTVVITDGGSGYAKGCLYVKTNAGAGTEGLYRNIGTNTSCNFDAINVAAAPALADGKIWIGDGAGNAAEVTLSGDVTTTNAGVTSIGAKKVTAAKTAVADGKIFIGGASGAAAEQTLSGDVTMTNAGVVTIGNDKITSAKIDPAVLKVATTTIATADVLTLNGTPVVLVAPVAGKAIVVDSIIGTINYVSAAYTTNTTLEFSYTTATTKVTADIGALLNATADKVVKVGGIEAALVCPVNDGIQVKVAAGNPAVGDSDITITVVYRLITAA